MKRTSIHKRTPVPALVFCGGVMLSLAACGQTGPLFLPDETSQEAAADAEAVSEQAAEESVAENEETP